MNDIEKMLQNAKNNSIGAEKKEELKKGKKNIRKKFMLLVTIGALLLSLCACGNDYSDDISNNYNDNVTVSQEYIDYREGEQIVSNRIINVLDMFASYGIDVTKTIEEDIVVYKQIKELNEDDLIVYYDIVGEKECVKILNVLGYKDWNDYLKKKNCLDESGEPSIFVWLHNTYVSIGSEVEIGGYTK